jgi:hypothetical protein
MKYIRRLAVAISATLYARRVGYIYCGAYCLHHQGDHQAKLLRNVGHYQITRCNIPEDSHLSIFAICITETVTSTLYCVMVVMY